jgi:hypothetical protein
MSELMRERTRLRVVGFQVHVAGGRHSQLYGAIARDPEGGQDVAERLDAATRAYAGRGAARVRRELGLDRERRPVVGDVWAVMPLGFREELDRVGVRPARVHEEEVAGTVRVFAGQPLFAAGPDGELVLLPRPDGHHARPERSAPRRGGPQAPARERPFLVDEEAAVRRRRRGPGAWAVISAYLGLVDLEQHPEYGDRRDPAGSTGPVR